jgi:hypothetical protein
MDALSLDELIERTTKRIVSKDAHNNWFFPTLKGIWWPFDEFGEVNKERRFDLILDRWIEPALRSRKPATAETRGPWRRMARDRRLLAVIGWAVSSAPNLPAIEMYALKASFL